MAVARAATRGLPFWFTRVRSHSMAPALRDGQLVLTVRPRGAIRRGAVVAVDSKAAGRRIVKRVIGLPGERVRIDDGLVWIGGDLLPEPYASRAAYRGTFDVPAAHYLLLGDNRAMSTDARSWPMPYVCHDEIVGVLICRSPSPA